MADEIIDSLLESIREKQNEIIKILKTPEFEDFEIDELLQDIIDAQDELIGKLTNEIGEIQDENYAEVQKEEHLIQDIILEQDFDLRFPKPTQKD